MSEETLRRAYPRWDENPALYQERIEKVCEGFAKTYGAMQDIRVFSAPGRTEIGGNHTDHQHGCVLAASVDLDILCAARKNNSTEIRMISEGFSQLTVDISDLTIHEEEKNTSASLIRGIAAKIASMGYAIHGFDAYAISSVLGGSGLSSSAAYEVLIGTILNGLYCDSAISPVEIAKIGQYAENVFFGKPCGLMDQMASAVGGIIAIDFQQPSQPEIHQIQFDLLQEGYALCIIDSGADHADLTDEYAFIPQEMCAVAACFDKKWLREVRKEDFMRDMARVRRQVGDRAVLRAIHFYADNTRAQQEAKLLAQGDFDAFLQVMRQSGQSSYMYLQNVSVNGAVQEQQVAYALAMCDELLGDRGAFRVHGGGFAGTVQAFVPLDMLEHFCVEMEKALAAHCCHVLSIRPAGGIELSTGKGV